MRLGYEASHLGLPRSDTIDLGSGCSYNDFMGGAIYYHPLLGGHVLHGPILDKWREMGAEKSVLGYPVGDTETTIDKQGKYQRFQYGDIYCHPDFGAFEVTGKIRIRWYELGGTVGKLGYPVSGIKRDNESHRQKFQRGMIIWHAGTKQMEIQEH